MPSDADQSGRIVSAFDTATLGEQPVKPAPARPDRRLQGLSDLFAQRGQQYGDSFLKFGPVMRAIFPDGLELTTADEWNRFALFFMCVVKLHRYGMKFHDGGQADSLDDTSVYAQMLAYVDELKGASK